MNEKILLIVAIAIWLVALAANSYLFLHYVGEENVLVAVILGAVIIFMLSVVPKIMWLIEDAFR